MRGKGPKLLLDLPALVQPGLCLGFRTGSTHCWILSSFAATRTPRPFSAGQLLMNLLSPSLCSCLGSGTSLPNTRVLGLFHRPASHRLKFTPVFGRTTQGCPSLLHFLHLRRCHGGAFLPSLPSLPSFLFLPSRRGQERCPSRSPAAAPAAAARGSHGAPSPPLRP